MGDTRFLDWMVLQNENTINIISNYPAESGLTWPMAKDGSLGKIVFHAGVLRGGCFFFAKYEQESMCYYIDQQ